MAKHNLTVTLPECTLGRADATFVVRQDESKLGTLTVSNGSLVWFPVKAKYGYKLTWSELDDVMKRHATRYEYR